MRDLIRDRLNELTVETWWDGYQYTEIRDKDYIANCILDDFNNLILVRIKELETNRTAYIKSGAHRTAYENTCIIEELKNLLK